MYNFHVKEWASYFVGKVRVYVHNGKTEKYWEALTPISRKAKILRESKNGTISRS
ncbi:hypothetical protein [uncultured Clostridium sp.]|uniref:hypothetical protein n=1 Tax=uncultured Clostridium sp. TaxID=59620 RepID=UPI00272B61B0|nr:hypothetical protein [uncultured Clostridium sp.]